MKFNKKIVVASLSTVMGLSLVGAITGVVAWYQYSTRATASFVATSVANTGVLQIGQKVDTSFVWHRDLAGVDLTGSTNENKLSPVTFGATTGENNTLPATAYTNPESGLGAYSNWLQASKGKEYLQFDVYLQAKKVANNASTGADELVAREVYLTDLVLADVNNNKAAAEALRMHIAVYNGETNTKNFLISKNGVSELQLYGHLDLDGVDGDDKVKAYPWEANYGQTCMYGNENEKQTAQSIRDIKCERDENGDIYYLDQDGSTKHYKSATDDTLNGKVICTTNTSTTAPVKLTITVWLEGWHKYGNPGTAVWDGLVTANTNINVGMTFDVGYNAFR